MPLIFSFFLIMAVPEDSNELYLMDMNWTTFPSEWDLAYDSSLFAFRSTQGCLDLIRWYIVYEIKFRYPLYKGFGVRYSYYEKDDYDEVIKRHRIEPFLKLKGNYFGHLMVTPNFGKIEDEIGAGISWFPDPLNYWEFFFIVKDFDNNFSLQRTRTGEEKDLYTDLAYPYKLTLEFRKEFKYFRVKNYTEYVTTAKKELQDPENHRTKYFSSYRGYGRIETKPMERMMIGTVWEYNGSEEKSEFTDSVTSDTLRKWMVEPYLSFFFTDKWELNIQFRFTEKLHNLYKRYWFGPSIYLNYRVNRGIEFIAGYQSSIRKRWRDGLVLYDSWHDFQNRIALGVQFIFPNRARLLLYEGIELDGAWKWKLTHPHNHTYASLFLPI